MLLQTNSYIVPKERRAEHSRLIRRFRQALANIGCDQFDVYEQIGANWNPAGANGRYVQLMRFRDQQHQIAVQEAERKDAGAQAIIAEFCALINFPYQQQHGYFATGFYTSVMPIAPRLADESTPEVINKAAADIPRVDPAPELPIVWENPGASLPEPDAAEHAALAHEPPSFGETAIADTLVEHPEALEAIGLSAEPDVVESSQDLTQADKLALADKPTGLDAFGLSDEPTAIDGVAPGIPQSAASNVVPDLEFRTGASSPYKSPAVPPIEGPLEIDDEADLLDLSAVELTDEEVASQQSLEIEEDGSTGPAHNLAESQQSRNGDGEPAHDRIILDATLPEEDAFGNLLDDANILDHAPLPGHGQPAAMAHDSHNSAEAGNADAPEENDADLLEFDTYLRQLKEGSA